jgi:gamma-butyrobetaine dioxygenase
LKHPQAYQALSEIPVAFSYINDGHHMHYKRLTINDKGLTEPLQVYYSPPFQGTLDLDAGTSEKFYSAMSKLEDILADPSLVYKTYLNPGDCVIFANRRVLHGRESFDPFSGIRHFKGTYVDWDDFKDKLRVRNIF